MSRGCHIWLCFGLLIIGLASSPTSVYAQEETLHLQPPPGALIVPDKFLRRWDSVTLFFDHNTGPDRGGPEDHPGRYVSLTPAHPGAFTWLNARTLQFRPTEPWPPLTRFTWQIHNKRVELTTLMSAPVSSIPNQNARNLHSVKTITLTFPEPLDQVVLNQMISIELRPLPGVGSGRQRWLDADDFDIKVIERRNRSDHATYVLLLHNPIAEATTARLHLRLSLEDRMDEAFHDIVFSTAEPFRITQFGCPAQRLPTTIDGVDYAPEQAIRCQTDNRRLDIMFSAKLKAVGPIVGRNLVRLTPTVSNLQFHANADNLGISGDFAADTLYRLRLQPSLIKDQHDRSLQMNGASQLYLYFPQRPRVLRFDSKQGVLERYGPQMVPLQGRGFERLDLRIYPIDPLNRSFWPFPNRPIVVNEDQRPPAPGEEPQPFKAARRYIAASELARHIKALGSPSISELVALPLRKGGKMAKFGLDLQPFLERMNGQHNPGTFLVGIRQLGISQKRNWIRVQVTDLSLTTVEEPDRVVFAVTSLSTGLPIAGAHIRIEGSRNRRWLELTSGYTKNNGRWVWQAPDDSPSASIRRIVVSRDGDTLVLDPTRAPEKYHDKLWRNSSETWLQWTQANLSTRRPAEQFLCHMFTERPVYRPDHAVHIKVYVRQHFMGELSPAGGRGTLVVEGPDKLEWRYPQILSDSGSFYHLFAEEKIPTGEYQAYFEYGKTKCGRVSFKKEAYRLPKFEVQLRTPQTTRLDAPFTVSLSARYYAGGQVADRPVRWRITQYPYNWTPGQLEGFTYSSDPRFSGDRPFQSTAALQKEARTDEQGAATLVIDPTAEPTSQPRRYVVECTVVGADDQTVSAVESVLALPPFVLGIKVPRYLQEATSIDPEVVVAGANRDLIAGQQVMVRLLQRQWHSHLQASDFSQGVAKYVTEVVDDAIFETQFESTTQPKQLHLPIERAGVYIIEVEAQDKLGRTQVVSVDLFAGGDEPVTWSRPPTRVFAVTPDKKIYDPGETARLVLESPFQNARVLTVVEAPNGRNRYQWLDIHNGSATYALPIKKQFMPRIPVHFILMRGRLNTDKAPSANGLDLAKPATLATTAWVEVSTREHRVDVALTYPPKAEPGQKIDITIALQDEAGHPLVGEATLWLVDQAVLALGQEQRLDPLPDFVVQRKSRLDVRDTRNLAVGFLPLQEQPGGDLGAKEGRSLLDKATIRKKFIPVPYYEPAIRIGPSGQVTVNVTLPDNLTNFKIRAKVISGPDRFGFATGHLAVRLPVIVQPSLPRFIRPGDAFTATAIGRIIEGDAGPGVASVQVEGLELHDPAEQNFTWQSNRPQRIDYRMTVPTPQYDAEGRLSRDQVEVTLAVERSADKARDAFAVTLPIQPDRKPIVQRQLLDLQPGQTAHLKAIEAAVQSGTLQRSVLLSDQPALVRMAAGLNYLLDYPHECTEQRISRARAQIAAQQFQALLYEDDAEARVSRERAIRETLQWLESVVVDNNLIAYWPGSRGYVSLTAWVVQFMLEAKRAGFQIDSALLNKLIHALQQSLRSDYANFITGTEYAERSWALTALAQAALLDDAYAAELARRAEYLNLESLAQVTYALSQAEAPEIGIIKALHNKMWQHIVLRLHRGKEMYGGLQKQTLAGNRLILPSETRALAEMLRAVAGAPADASHQKEGEKILLDAIVTLGQDNGWGTTNANASALLALVEFLSAPRETDTQTVRITLGKDRQERRIGGKHALQHVASNYGGEITLSLVASDTLAEPVTIRSETQYLPMTDGSRTPAAAQGFVVVRELLHVQPDRAPDKRLKLDAPGQAVNLAVGDVIEEHIEVVNPEDRNYVAVVIPLAAGMEPLNPALATAPPEAKPRGQLTLAPSYVAYLDDQVAYYYDTLPKGTYHFYFRTRATIAGRFIQPAAYAEMMYRQAVSGNSHGSVVVITANP